MKKLVTIRFAATLAVATLSMSGLAGGQTSEFAAKLGNSSPTAPKSASATAFDYYFKIQTALAQDSLQNLAVNAHALAQAVRKDTTGAFPAALAAQADALGREITLAGARLSFAVVSGQLINSLKARPGLAKDVHQVHCPRTRLDWLQRGDQVQNPYLGTSMPRCGKFVS